MKNKAFKYGIKVIEYRRKRLDYHMDKMLDLLKISLNRNEGKE